MEFNVKIHCEINIKFTAYPYLYITWLIPGKQFFYWTFCIILNIFLCIIFLYFYTVKQLNQITKTSRGKAQNVIDRFNIGKWCSRKYRIHQFSALNNFFFISCKLTDINIRECWSVLLCKCVKKVIVSLIKANYLMKQELTYNDLLVEKLWASYEVTSLLSWNIFIN